jgi:HEAT repeat protein
MSRSAATLSLFQNLFETMPARELKRRALTGIGRNDNSDAAATYLIRVAESDADLELQKQAVIAIGKLPKDKAVPILIRTARSHQKMAVRKVAIQVLGQTGDERAVAFFSELLSKD